jgi:hypothetical protein
VGDLGIKSCFGLPRMSKRKLSVASVEDGTSTTGRRRFPAEGIEMDPSTPQSFLN